MRPRNYPRRLKSVLDAATTKRLALEAVFVNDKFMHKAHMLSELEEANRTWSEFEPEDQQGDIESAVLYWRSLPMAELREEHASSMARLKKYRESFVDYIYEFRLEGGTVKTEVRGPEGAVTNPTGRLHELAFAKAVEENPQADFSGWVGTSVHRADSGEQIDFWC